MTETSIRIRARRVRRVRRLPKWLAARESQLRPLLQDFDRYVGIFIWLGLAVGMALIGTFLSTRSATIDPVEEVAALDLDAVRPSLDPPDDARVPMPAQYIVESGDTLLSVAYRFGSSVDAIRLASGIDDADRLSIGQTLIVPPARSMIQQVDPESPLAEVAQSFSLDAELVAAYNGRSANRVSEAVGQNVVVIPPQRMDPATVQAASGGTNATQQVSGRSSDPVVYTVAEGDTILSIAAKLGVEPAKLVAANRLADTDWIVVGDSLSVPLWSQTVAASPAAVPPDETGMVFAASLGTEAAEAATQRSPVVYEVVPGDTLSSLAVRFGVDTDTIVTVNQLLSADTIGIGEQLTILPVSGVLYNVQPGDSLSRIAALFEVDLGPIIDFNYLEDADRLAAGTELIIPGGRPLPQEVTPVGPPVYVVAPGDTAVAIARRFGVTTADIVAANGLSSADRLAVGQSLTIEAGAAARGTVNIASTQRQAAGSIRQQQQTVTRNLPVPAPSIGRSTGTASGGGIVSIASRFQGARYVWGGTTPSGFDCSGFVYYVLSQAGSPIPRGMWGQYNAGMHPSRADLQPGDIVFFQNTYMAGLSHNGIYIGNGQFIHASDPSTGVTTSSLSSSYWASRWFGATRVR